MEMKAPYLEAIQAIDGTIPGDKQKRINDIARQIARVVNSGDDSVKVGNDIPDIPGPLKPLVYAEVAKILHQYEGIIAALKSEDITVVSRALQAKWFFDGSETSFVNAKYFLENVFPHVSFYARLKIIKNLAIYLKNPSIAADFFLTLVQLYGVSQATPLLMACDGDFAFDMIVDNKIVFTPRMAADLYQKYPNLIIKYLKLSDPKNYVSRNLHHIDISDYTDLLSGIGNDHFDDFMQIYGMHESLDVKLGKRGVNTFVKTRLNLLLNEPDKYLKLLSLRTVTHKLSYEEFAEMFKNLFPPMEEDFDYCSLNDYLTYYKPEEERINLVLSTFKVKYGEDLLQRENLVVADLMTNLPATDRIKLARLKLAKDNDWHFDDPEHSWRCYLPTSESIPAIQKEIAKTSDAPKRGDLLKQLITTSRINDDEDALLKVLTYIYDRHKNDKKYIFYNCLSLVCDSFDLATLSLDHWEILDQYIQMAEMQDQLDNESSTMKRVLEAGIHYCSLNGLPVNNYVRIVVDMNIHLYSASWNILTEFPDMNKKYLDLFIRVIPNQYPFDDKIWKDRGAYIIRDLASSIWEFNSLNSLSNDKLKRLSVRNYPWLFEKIEAFIFGETSDDEYARGNFLKSIKQNERDLYRILLRELDQFWRFGAEVISDVLKMEPQRVLDNWKRCFEKVRDSYDYNFHPSSFVTKSRWYQQLPINIFNKSLEKHADEDLRIKSMVTLALLTDGQTYAKIIKSWIPDVANVHISNTKARYTRSMLIAIASNLRHVNPPISLDVVEKFCVGDYLQFAVRFLTSVCRRVTVREVIPFAERLTKKGVSVMKHGIRLTYHVAPLEEIYELLTNIWNTVRHTSIREVLFRKMYDLFSEEPNIRSWNMIQKYIDSLDNKDDDEVFKKLTMLYTIPNEFLEEYIKSVLNILKSVEKTSDDPKLFIGLSCQLIKNIDGPMVKILPEEFSQELIKRYLFVFDYDPIIFEAGSTLTINSYLLSSKSYNESRFKFFGHFFRDSVQKYWDKRHPKCFNYYPMNSMTYAFFQSIHDKIDRTHDVKNYESLLKTFVSALKPQKDAITYVNLVFGIEYVKSTDIAADFANRIVKKIPELVETFSPECIISISQRLTNLTKYYAMRESENAEERLMIIIEILANCGNIHCAFIAAQMLFNVKSKNLKKRHELIIHTLKNFNHPGIFWYVNEHLAKQPFAPSNDK